MAAAFRKCFEETCRDLGFRVQGTGLKVVAVGLRVQHCHSGLAIQGLGFEILCKDTDIGPRALNTTPSFQVDALRFSR